MSISNTTRTATHWNLEDVYLHIDSGMTVGILGGTGSAKSTLVSLIPRLYDGHGGRCVRWADRTCGTTTMEALRDGLCHGAAEERAVLRHHPGKPPLGRRERHRRGDGGGLPPGLRRRVYLSACPTATIPTLSRAAPTCPAARSSGCASPGRILKQPKILILDDSTSAVDTATDARIRAALREALPGYHQAHHRPAHLLRYGRGSDRGAGRRQDCPA